MLKQACGENGRILDLLFLNTPRLSYIDPTLDRCAAAHEWLSSFDLFRATNSDNAAIYSIENMYIPSAAAATHLFCRIEQRPDLVFTIRDLFEIQQKVETNQALVHKFVEGLSLRFQGSRCPSNLVQETLPYLMWILSAGEGSGRLCRATSSLDLLKPKELEAFNRHVIALQAMGLTYVLPNGAFQSRKDKDLTNSEAVLDPPIDRLVQFTGLELPEELIKVGIPLAVSKRMC